MSERYSRLFTLPQNLYAEGSPAVIAAGALLKDNKTGKVLVQLKICNIGNNTIKAAKINIQPLDTVNSKLGKEVVYTYLDLSVTRDEEFGQKTLIPLPDNESRGFKVYLVEVAFEDNSVWKDKGSEWESFPAYESLDTVLSNELIKQYRIKYGENCIARPKKVKDLWYCACGALNHEGESCHACGKTYAELTSLEWEKLKTELEEKAEVYRKDEIYASGTAKMTGEDISNYEDAIRTFQRIHDWKDSNEQIEICRKKIDEIKANREASTKKFKKIVSISAIAVAVCIAAFFVVTKVVIPNNNYNAAFALMKSGDYEAAITAFEAMEGYKDSAAQIENCETGIKDHKYNAALELYNSGKYEEAIVAFEAMHGYKDSVEYVEKCEIAIKDEKYNTALQLLDAGDYNTAYTLLQETGHDEDIDKNKYDRAMKLLDSGDYEEVCTLLKGLSYKDSEDKYNIAWLQYEKSILSKASVGDTVIFGSYEQDDNTSNGKEDIEWLVLEKEGNKILVISDKALDCQNYNTSYTDVTWETCSLRKWMNGTFLNNAFSADEQALIQRSTVSADKNPNYSINPGNATTDKVFLLSITEAEKYFSSDENRKCVPSAYAIAQGAATFYNYTKGGKETCWWWLRTPEYSQKRATVVNLTGEVDPKSGCIVNPGSIICVRPAMWIEVG